MDKIPTSAGLLSPAEIVAELTYRSYAFNRDALTAEQLARLFPQQAASFESRYQRERGAQ